MKSIQKSIENSLMAAFDPEHLEVINESKLHEGHAQAPKNGESHFRLLLVSEKFSGHSKLARQRQVYAVLKDLMSTHIHALSMATFTPSEYEQT